MTVGPLQSGGGGQNTYRSETNPLTFKSYYHLFSSYISNPESLSKVTEIKEIITN